MQQSPTELNIISVEANPGSVQINNGSVTASLGSLGSGKSATVRFTANSIAAGTFTTLSEVTSTETDLNVANNSLVSSKTISAARPERADLELTQTLSSTNVKVGDQVRITVTLTNKGPGIASGIKVSDRLPTGLTLVSAFPEQGAYDSTTGIWDVGNLRNNLSRRLEITATVAGAGSKATLISQSEVIAVNEADPDSRPNNRRVGEDDLATSTLTLTSRRVAGTPRPDTLVGNDGDDLIIGFAGADTITTNAGRDLIVYTALNNRGDTITDFQVGQDRIVLTELFARLQSRVTSYRDAIDRGFLSFRESNGSTTLLLDRDGAGRQTPQNYITVNSVTASALNNATNFVV